MSANKSAQDNSGNWLLRIVLPPLLIATAGAVTAWLVVSRDQLEPQFLEPLPIPVEVARAVLQPQQVNLRSRGHVQPGAITGITAEVEGRIVEVSPNFVKGGFARSGEVLLKIDDSDYQTALRRAKAQVASARSNLAQEQGRALVAERDWAARNRSFGSSDVASELALRKPQLAEAEAQLEAELATEQEAQINLRRTVIRAPFDGLVQSQSADLGQYARVGDTIAVLYSVDYAEVRLPIPDNRLDYVDLPGIERGHYPTVVLAARVGESEHRWHARIIRTEGVFDERSHTLFAVARVVNPYGLGSARPGYVPLRFGSFVTAVISGRVLPDLVTLPRTLLRTNNQIWLVDEQNRLRNRRVDVLHTGSEVMYVSSGLRNGDRVCLSPVSNALPGTLLKILGEVSSDALNLDHEAEDADQQYENDFPSRYPATPDPAGKLRPQVEPETPPS